LFSALEESGSPLTDQELAAVAEGINQMQIAANANSSSNVSGNQAQASTSSVASASSSGSLSSPSPPSYTSLELECPLCNQHCVLPVELPCLHIFCFFCIKGVRLQSSRVSVESGTTYHQCPICQAGIPPASCVLLKPEDAFQLIMPVSASGYEWFYEARGGGQFIIKTYRNKQFHKFVIKIPRIFFYTGWWPYDKPTSRMIEKFYATGRDSCLMYVAGYVYEINFRLMIQFRPNDSSSTRGIRRDIPQQEEEVTAHEIPGIQAPRMNEIPLFNNVFNVIREDVRNNNDSDNNNNGFPNAYHHYPGVEGGTGGAGAAGVEDQPFQDIPDLEVDVNINDIEVIDMEVLEE